MSPMLQGTSAFLIRGANHAGPGAGSLAAGSPFSQSLNPAHSTLGSTLVALIPIVLLLILLPVMRMSAWQAVIIGAVVTIILAITVWGAPVGDTLAERGVGAGTGLWPIDWLQLWVAITFRTLGRTVSYRA